MWRISYHDVNQIFRYQANKELIFDSKHKVPIDKNDLGLLFSYVDERVYSNWRFNFGRIKLAQYHQVGQRSSNQLSRLKYEIMIII